MWTYLTILFSIILILVIFGRRAYLLIRAQKLRLARENAGTEEPVEELKQEQISKSEKQKVEEFCELAEKNLRSGKEDEAIKYLVQALAIDSLHIEAQHKLAMLYMQKQMFAAAAVLFKQLGELTDEAVHYSHLGLALYQQNNFPEAKDAYQRAIVLDDSRPQRYASLSQVYRAMGQMQNAIIALKKATDLDAENLDYLLLLADLQKELANFPQAKEILEGILALDPENEFAKKDLQELKKLIET